MLDAKFILLWKAVKSIFIDVDVKQNMPLEME